MNIEELKKIIARIESVEQHSDFILGLARPCVDIRFSDAPVKDSGSRFGGYPYVPTDFLWPTHDVGEYRFLGQINFADIVNRPESLPSAGLLTFFYVFDEDGEVFWGDDGYVIGFYWPTFEKHSIFDSPASTTPNSIAIQLTGGIDIPRDESLRSDWPFESNILYELVDALGENNDYLLGYPSFNTLAYNPTPDGDWISLLTIHSHDEFDWCWHDGDKLMVFIEAEKLAEQDFSHLKSDAG